MIISKSYAYRLLKNPKKQVVCEIFDGIDTHDSNKLSEAEITTGEYDDDRYYILTDRHNQRTLHVRI